MWQFMPELKLAMIKAWGKRWKGSGTLAGCEGLWGPGSQELKGGQGSSLLPGLWSSGYWGLPCLKHIGYGQNSLRKT